MKQKIIIYAQVFFLVFILLQTSFAAVRKEDVAKLKTTLTPFGAERSGNKDGTIPPWEGGYSTVPSSYTPSQKRPDPFEQEKPLYSVTSQNIDQYAEKLSEGGKALLKKYPTFRIDVYPSHRTAAAPQYVVDNTIKNATRAKTLNNGLSVDGCYGGIPFPIPSDAYEIMWNHLLAWRGVSFNMGFRNYLVTRSGRVVLISEAEDFQQFPYYLKDVPMEEWTGDFWHFRQLQNAPPFKAGESLLTRDPVDQFGKGRQSWQYLTGQRRVRRAPAVSYDTPDFVSSGQLYFDEVFVFNGALDRYDWKVLGKKEMIIPYNCNKFFFKKDAEVLGKNYLNPEHVRWELHRIWVVEATLAKGKRHAVPKRRFYIDEDTWRAIMSDGWDGRGQLWRFTMALPYLAMDMPCVLPITQAVFNLQAGSYAAILLFNEMPKQIEIVPPRSDSFFKPDALAGAGVR